MPSPRRATSLAVASISADASACLPRSAARIMAAYGASWLPVASVTACPSSISAAAAVRSPANSSIVGARAEGERKLAQRAGLAGELDVPAGQRVPALVVPQMQGRRRLSATASAAPRPTDMPLPKAVSACRRIGTPAAYPSVKFARQAVEQQVGRARRVRRPRRRRRRGPPPATPPPGLARRPGEDRGGQRVQVGLAGQVGVERLEPPGRLQQQQRGVAAAVA